jgi:hypothetical protein
MASGPSLRPDVAEPLAEVENLKYKIGTWKCIISEHTGKYIDDTKRLE